MGDGGPAAWVASVTPYYSDDLVTIYHGDCREVLPSLEEHSVDLLLTDPPYNFGLDYGGHDDTQVPTAYAEWCHAWFGESSRVTRRQLVFPGHGNLPVWWGVRKPSAIGCWYKPGNPASSHIGWSEWEPYLYWGTRVGGSDVTRAPVSEQQDTGDHPCPKPLGLFRLLIGKFKAESVIDPFLGSGTTLAAAKYMGIPGVGIEVNEAYCEIAANRCRQGTLGLVA